MTATSELYLAYTTCASEADAQTLAQGLVQAHLAFCVNIGPSSTSVYPWAGQVQTAEERVLTIKTRADKIEALKAHVGKHHPYEVPELVWVPIDGGLEAYVAWAHEWLSVPST